MSNRSADPEIARLFADLKASAPNGQIIIVKQGEGHRRWARECERLAKANAARHQD